MDLTTFLIVIGVFLSWGVGSFIAKLATNRIGAQSVFWDVLTYAPVVIIWSLIIFKLENFLRVVKTDKLGIGLALLSGIIGSFGLIGSFILLAREEASTIIPLTALYPALTAVLAITFLHESITPTKISGIILSLIAIYLLGK
jgi:transporter family protein